MKVRLVPSSVQGGDELQFLTTFLINDTVAVDAGGLGFFGGPLEQARVRHVFLSHSHIDHLASLPVFLENVYQVNADCVTVHGNEAVLTSLRQDLFNNRVWPDFVNLGGGRPPYLQLALLEAGRPVAVDRLTVTPVAVNHSVPTFGFVVADETSAVVFPSDTGPTAEIWERVNATPEVRAVFLEATFPDQLTWLADLSKHLTPGLFAEEVRKVARPVRFLAVHIKPRFQAAVAEQLRLLGLPNVEIAQSQTPYLF